MAKKAAITGGLEVSALLNRAGILASARGLGAIFTLHHVRPFQPRAINPNRHLEITPEFLEAAILRLKAEGYRFARLDEVPDLLEAGDRSSPFAVFTLDDGYRDNRDFALPVFERHGVPFTIFICKGFSERSHSMWWETADMLANGTGPLRTNLTDDSRQLPLKTDQERDAAFAQLCRMVDEADDEASAIGQLDALARAAGVEPLDIPRTLVMDAGELQDLARHPLVSLGAHTVSHRALARLGATELAEELQQSADYVASITGARPATFAYPYGDRRSVTPATTSGVSQAGFSVAVTTAPGTLDGSSLDAMTQLPRISLNGFYQSPRYVAALASGIAFKLTGR